MQQPYSYIYAMRLLHIHHSERKKPQESSGSISVTKREEKDVRQTANEYW